MANLIQSAKAQVSQLTAQAYEAAVAAGALPAGVELKGSVEIPKDPQNGDYASSVAMAGAKAIRGGVLPPLIGTTQRCPADIGSRGGRVGPRACRLDAGDVHRQYSSPVADGQLMASRLKPWAAALGAAAWSRFSLIG